MHARITEMELPPTVDPEVVKKIVETSKKL